MGEVTFRPYSQLGEANVMPRPRKYNTRKRKMSDDSENATQPTPNGKRKMPPNDGAIRRSGRSKTTIIPASRNGQHRIEEISVTDSEEEEPLVQTGPELRVSPESEKCRLEEKVDRILLMLLEHDRIAMPFSLKENDTSSLYMDGGKVYGRYKRLYIEMQMKNEVLKEQNEELVKRLEKYDRRFDMFDRMMSGFSDVLEKIREG